MRKSLFKNLPLNATFTYKGNAYRKIDPDIATVLDNSYAVKFTPNTTVNYHKSKPLDASHSNTTGQ